MLNATWFVLSGMAIVFATLALLAGAMMALHRWFEPGRDAPSAAKKPTRG